jgi:hypothetical protein
MSARPDSPIEALIKRKLRSLICSLCWVVGVAQAQRILQDIFADVARGGAHEPPNNKHNYGRRRVGGLASGTSRSAT